MIKIILFFLGRGIKATNKLDEVVKSCFERLGTNFIVKLKIMNSKTSMCFWKDNNRIKTKLNKKSNLIKENLTVEFKSKTHAKKVLLGKISIEQAFSSNYFKVSGDIAKAMNVVEILERVETYLFPKFMTKKLFKEPKQKYVSSVRIYMFVLFGI